MVPGQTANLIPCDGRKWCRHVHLQTKMRSAQCQDMTAPSQAAPQYHTGGSAKQHEQVLAGAGAQILAGSRWQAVGALTPCMMYNLLRCSLRWISMKSSSTSRGLTSYPVSSST